MLEAFAAQSAQLAQSSTDWKQLKSAASSGQLRMQHSVAEQAARRCEEMIDTLDEHFRSATNLRFASGMGECIIGGLLSDKFTEKATGESNSLSSVIRQHQQILTDMAATYRAAGASFTSQEDANVDALGPTS